MWNRHVVARSLLGLVLLSPVALFGSPGGRTAVGTAYAQDTGYVLYTEHHFCRDDGRVCTVQYRDASGAMIAQKILDYRDSSIRPGLSITDYRSDLELTVAASTREDLVVDAGFDNYVRSNWDQLERGDSVRFPFLVAGFDKPIDMRAERETSGDCHSSQLCLQVTVDSWLLGMLVSPIELAYSRHDRTLLRFSGVSNIKGSNGESLNVDIRYQYVDERLPDETSPATAIRF